MKQQAAPAPLKIQQTDDQPVERNVLATAIVDVSRGVKRLLDGGLTERAVVVLLADTTGITKTMCRDVLRGISRLEATYCSK